MERRVRSRGVMRERRPAEVMEAVAMLLLILKAWMGGEGDRG